jgi:hypothetical protein
LVSFWDWCVGLSGRAWITVDRKSIRIESNVGLGLGFACYSKVNDYGLLLLGFLCWLALMGTL